MSPQKKARLTFASALTLLLIGGIVGGLTIARLIDSAKWISHTYEVRLTLSALVSDLGALGRARTGYLLSGNGSYLSDFQAAKSRVPLEMQSLGQLVKDNPVQLRNYDDLQSLIARRSEILNASMSIQGHGQAEDDAQNQYSLQLAGLATDYNAIAQRMQKHEQDLFDQRIKVSNKLLIVVVVLLIFTFTLATGLLWTHYRFLTAEVNERVKAELNARNSEDASRRLSARLLHLQDEERRRFSRELHDSLGQSLSVAKMIAESLARQNPLDKSLPQLVSVLDESLSETRTISHLLHPPLLDELGLVSAVKWYVDGFAKRSGVEIASVVPDGIPRLPRSTELAFFRALQELLTNIHRHSKCTRADVLFEKSANELSLVVKDNGKGVPKEILDSFQLSGTQVGVGLAGMRERIREQGGSFTIQSSSAGTTVWVTLPIVAAAVSDAPAIPNDVVSL